MEAEYGEILTTCEKIRHIIRHGEDALKYDTHTHTSLMMMTMMAR